jgi:IMP dehydrogenase
MNQDFPVGLSYNDVLLVPQYSEINSRSDVDLSTQITPHVKLQLPIISINMTDVTGVKMAITLGKLGGLGFLPRFYSPEEQADMVSEVKKAGVTAAAAVGCRDGFLERAEQLARAGADIITLDVAHAHMLQALEATKKLKERFGKNIDIVSGVVGTYGGTEDLYRYGADSVRIGVGPGTICITRIVTGSGVPQITALLNAQKAAKKWKRTIICDGGTSNSGDVVKGLAAGASAVLIGSQLAGADESPGKKITRNGQFFKVYNASTSYAEKKRYFNSKGENLSKNYLNQIEGVESVVKYTGPLENTITKMSANIRSGLSYSGARNIFEFWKKAEFIKITPLGSVENGSHNVMLAS